MMKNKTRFNQFLDSIEGINPKILSARLKEMEKTGLIKRKVYSEIPVRVEYFLTEKGRALKSILDQMASFSIQYCSRDVFKGGKPSSLPQTYLIEKKQIQIHFSKLTVKIIVLALTEGSFTRNSSLMNQNIYRSYSNMRIYCRQWCLLHSGTHANQKVLQPQVRKWIQSLQKYSYAYSEFKSTKNLY